MISTIYFRLVEESDAAFIYSLRKNPDFNKYLSSVDDGIEKQVTWIKMYKEKEKTKQEYYYIIHRKDNDLSIGTVRIYDFMPKESSFCWGSWILNENKTKYAALESAIMIYDFAFFELGYNRCHMNIRKENKKVIEFHKKFGVKIIGESDIDYFGHYFKEDYLKIRENIVHIINNYNNQYI